MKLSIDAHEVTVYGINLLVRSVWLFNCNTSGMSVDFQTLCYRGFVGFTASCLGLVAAV